MAKPFIKFRNSSQEKNDEAMSANETDFFLSLFRRLGGNRTVTSISSHQDRPIWSLVFSPHWHNQGMKLVKCAGEN
jgi:hypothetical protein